MINPEVYQFAPAELCCIVPGIVFLLGAFSAKVRKQILERDGYKCVDCGSHEWLEACHVDHNKENPRYDDVSNGSTRCTPDHLMEHINREGRNGLTIAQNRFGIRRMIERIKHNYHEDTD